MISLDTIRLNSRTIISPENLICCEGNSNYTNLYFTNRKMVTIPKTLKKVVMEISDGSFVRIHKKYLINIRYLKKLEGEYVTMSNDSFFAIARRRHNDLNKALQNVAN